MRLERWVGTKPLRALSAILQGSGGGGGGGNEEPEKDFEQGRSWDTGCSEDCSGVNLSLEVR